ncbi:MAG: hypothetical protein LUF89_11720 [Ruminococcus sp.]|nr:hypothetical protein [Ruminococcus sp.]
MNEHRGFKDHLSRTVHIYLTGIIGGGITIAVAMASEESFFIGLLAWVCGTFNTIRETRILSNDGTTRTQSTERVSREVGSIRNGWGERISTIYAHEDVQHLDETTHYTTENKCRYCDVEFIRQHSSTRRIY